MSLPGEFQLIRRYFAPLAGPGSLNLTDDAAVLELKPGWSLVATADTVVAGVHFLADDPPDLIARKALRVNLRPRLDGRRTVGLSASDCSISKH